MKQVYHKLIISFLLIKHSVCLNKVIFIEINFNICVMRKNDANKDYFIWFMKQTFYLFKKKLFPLKCNVSPRTHSQFYWLSDTIFAAATCQHIWSLLIFKEI